MLSELFLPYIRLLAPYSSARGEYQASAKEVLLDANESPWGEFNRYPDPQQARLKQALSIIWRVSPAQLILGNGSDELIDLLVRSTCRSGVDSILTFPPTYGMYKVVAAINGINVEEQCLNESFQIKLRSLSKAKLAFICSPNNPTGNLICKSRIIQFLDSFSGLTVVDEAYVDFALGEQSVVALLTRYPRLVVLRTLSKAWGLAGLRIGAALAAPEIINVLCRIKPPYNVSTPGQELALRALDEPERMRRTVQRILAERERLVGRLATLSEVEQIFPSDSNFLLVRFKDADKAYESLKSAGVIVRNRSREPSCSNCLRITIGSPEQNDKVIEVLRC